MIRSRLRRKPPKTKHDLVAAALWWDAVTQDKRGQTRPCCVCGSRVAVEGHHVITKAAIKSYAATQRIDPQPLLWDPRNGIPVCRREHTLHTDAHRRLPLSAVPTVAWLFARELGLDWQIERYYR